MSIQKYKGLVLSMVSGIYYGSWNVFPSDKEGLLIVILQCLTPMLAQTHLCWPFTSAQEWTSLDTAAPGFQHMFIRRTWKKISLSISFPLQNAENTVKIFIGVLVTTIRRCLFNIRSCKCQL